MYRFHWITACVVWICTTGALMSGVRAGAEPVTGRLPSNVPPAVAAAEATQGNVLLATLTNGLRVAIVRNRLAPTVTTQITYLAGAYETPDGFPGTAHALEHMMFRGSRGLSEPQLDEMVGKMGADENAWTTSDATRFYFSAPARYLDLLLKIESIRMRGATLTQANWKLERGAIEQEVSRDVSDPDTVAYLRALRILYGGTGYAHDPLGTRPSFDKTTPSTLRNFYNRWYQPNNAVIVIVGDIEPQAVLAKMKHLFGPIARGDVPARAPMKLAPFKSQTIAMSTPDATGSVQFVYRMPGLRSPDHAAMRLLMDVLNNPRSRFSGLVAQGKILSFDFSNQPFAHGGVGILQAGFPKGGSAKQVQAQLQGKIDELLKHGVRPELVEAAKRQERARFEFARNGSYTEASAWSWALAWQGLDSPREALDRIEMVTPAEVERAARKYLKNDQRVTVVLTPGSSGKGASSKASRGGTVPTAGDQQLVVELPDWAARSLTKLEIPQWTLDPVTMKLSNGITLIVQPEKISKTVTVAGHIDHNDALQEPEGREGVGRLLDKLFDYGTAALDRPAFHRALDEIAATESAGTDFSLAVPSDHFDRGMQLLAANEIHPSLPQTAFRTQRNALARTLSGELQSPNYKMTRALDEGLLPAGDPALRQATPATVGSLTLQDVKEYLANVYRPDMTTIVVVGDVTPARAKSAVEKYFGAWKSTGSKPDVVPEPVPVNKSGYVVVPNPHALQDQVLMGQMMDLDLRNPERYALQLGNDVLGSNGGVGASRLMVDIRVNHGYAYNAGSDMTFGRSRSRFLVDYGSDPDKVSLADRLVRRDIQAMRDTPITTTELTNARQALIHSIPLEVSSVERIAQALLTWSYQGEPLDEPMVAARHYLHISAREVQEAFRKYVNPANLVQVVQGPRPETR